MEMQYNTIQPQAPRGIVDIQFDLHPDAFFELMGDAGIMYWICHIILEMSWKQWLDVNAMRNAM